MKAIILFFCIFVCHVVQAETNSNDNEKEMAQLQVKALFLYNFANFVEWPSDAFDSADAPIRMCLYGDLPFGIFLDSVDGTPIANRTLAVTRTNEIAEIAEGCHILFVGGERKASLPDFWKNVEFLFVLSVGEQEDFSDSGGIINIFRTEDQYQFEVNISNAMAAGLFLSSDLLSLARAVHENTK
ncbi:YfiR family protein [Simiduia curdlanivorans]|uniref:YfiR family protein n=1 Tax=Simiduia curdlanivorans TaxID=1492769 RepID=A0ABV8V4J2_9GAMM|nr:YfiR family protein [Simiduia curdlanivorans]MDN3637337.1 YfiR family protein [Simiduia curdlanivorans]